MATTYSNIIRDYALYDRALMEKKKALLKKQLDTPAAPIPESGTKDTRLYKARFVELEAKYKILMAELDQMRAFYEESKKQEQIAAKKNKDLVSANDRLKKQIVDTGPIMDRINTMIKDLHLPMETGEYRTAAAALEAFFGLIYTRIRVMEEEDVLAD